MTRERKIRLFFIGLLFVILGSGPCGIVAPGDKCFSNYDGCAIPVDARGL